MNARSLGVGLVLLVLASACTGSTPAASPDRTVDSEEAFQVGQEAIRECMSLEGFTYEPREYADGGRTGISRVVTIPDAATFGYAGTFASISSATTPSGGPEESMSKEEAQAYEKALFGPAEVAGDPNISPSSNESFRPGGCFGVGSKAANQAETGAGRVDWRDPDVSNRLIEPTQRLAATYEFSRFEDEWSACMAEGGYVASDPLGFPGSTSFDFLLRTDGFLAEQSTADIGDYRSLIADLDIQPVKDQETFEAALEQLPGLRAIFEEEKAIALYDKGCRDASFPLIGQILDELSEEYFGVPYANL